MLLYAHSVWGSVLDEFLGPNGWNAPELVSMTRQKGIFPSFWWYVPVEFMNLVHQLCNLVLILYIVGLGGRMISLFAWIIAISYAHRTSPANFGLDQITCMLTLYLMIAPATQFLSLDRWLRIKLGRKPEQLDKPSVAANVAMRLIQLHLCVIYLWAGLGKLQGEAWWNGNAMWLALANYEYQSMDLTWLARFPRLLEFLTHLTIAWEISFSFLVWPKPTRWIVLGLGVGMHLGICMFLGMWTFGSIMIFSYLSFSSGSWIRDRFRFWRLHNYGLVEQSEGDLDAAEESEAKVVEPVVEQPEERIEAAEPLGSKFGSSFDSTKFIDARSKPSVVLVTASERCLKHFLKLNQQANLNWIVAASIKEAEKLVPLLPDATFLLLEMRTKSDAAPVEYLSVRALRVKRSKVHSTMTAGSSAGSINDTETRRVHPK